MATSEIEQLWISQFQENLGALRKVAGWTTQQLANELGVARQTISNLETGRSPMTKLQYLALRTVFSAEIAECGNRELAKIIKTLVDDPIELRIKELGTAGSSDDAKETADNTKANSATEPDAPSEADDARPVAPASKPAAGRRARKNKERPLSTAMQALAVITAALASGTAAGVLTYLLFPNGKPGKNGRR